MQLYSRRGRLGIMFVPSPRHRAVSVPVFVCTTLAIYRMQFYSRRELTNINNVRFHGSPGVQMVFFPGHLYTKGGTAFVKQIINTHGRGDTAHPYCLPKEAYMPAVLS